MEGGAPLSVLSCSLVFPRTMPHFALLPSHLGPPGCDRWWKLNWQGLIVGKSEVAGGGGLIWGREIGVAGHFYQPMGFALQRAFVDQGECLHFTTGFA